jgi:hypothetical protein
MENVCTHLSKDKAGRDEPDTKASSTTSMSSRNRIRVKEPTPKPISSLYPSSPLNQHSLSQKINRTPHRLAINHSRTTGHNNPQKANHTKPNRHTDNLRPYSRTRGSSTRGKIGRVHNERGHVGDARHEGYDHRPGELRPVNFGRLVYDWTDSLGFDDGPDEEDDTGDGDTDSFGSEEVATGR